MGGLTSITRGGGGLRIYTGPLLTVEHKANNTRAQMEIVFFIQRSFLRVPGNQDSAGLPSRSPVTSVPRQCNFEKEQAALRPVPTTKYNLPSRPPVCYGTLKRDNPQDHSHRHTYVIFTPRRDPSRDPTGTTCCVWAKRVQGQVQEDKLPSAPTPGSRVDLYPHLAASHLVAARPHAPASTCSNQCS